MISTRIIKFFNKIFPPIEHPFNMEMDGRMTYARWEYEKAGDTIACYGDAIAQRNIFAGKRVLDMGCGAGGKSLYYASLGAEHVTGVDMVPRYKEQSESFAEELGLRDRFTFVLASAYELPFPDESFDTIIMNDFFEHVDRPELALKEALRLLSKDGKVYINFPPYYHPLGAHMTDVINMPWVQLFFTERQLIAAYEELVRGLPDEQERLALRFSTDSTGKKRFTYINHMTIRKAKRIFKAQNIRFEYYRELPLRRFLAPLTKVPFIKELFVRMVVCVIPKQG